MLVEDMKMYRNSIYEPVPVYCHNQMWCNMFRTLTYFDESGILAAIWISNFQASLIFLDGTEYSYSPIDYL